MNAPSSPGRTWSTLDPQRWLRALAAAVSATVRLARRRGTGVPGLARLASSSASTYDCDALDSMDERWAHRAGPHDMGNAVVALSVARLRVRTSRRRLATAISSCPASRGETP